MYDHGILMVRGVKYEPHIFLRKALKVAHGVFKAEGCLFVVTSLADREHSPGSLHDYGLAFDCRISHIDSDTIDVIVGKLKSMLIDYDVILESTHIHIEVKEHGY